MLSTYNTCSTIQWRIATIQATEEGASVKIMQHGHGHMHLCRTNQQYFTLYKLFKEMQYDRWK